jgi:hypothetical protein
MLTAFFDSMSLIENQKELTLNQGSFPRITTMLLCTILRALSLGTICSSILSKGSLNNEPRHQCLKTDFMLSGECSYIFDVKCVFSSLTYLRLCISIPLAGDRLIETGVEEICKMDHHNSEFQTILS